MIFSFQQPAFLGTQRPLLPTFLYQKPPHEPALPPALWAESRTSLAVNVNFQLRTKGTQEDQAAVAGGLGDRLLRWAVGARVGFVVV